MKKSKRFLNLYDCFEVKCKRCGSTNVELLAHECVECGFTISGECNDCHLCYNYHDFLQVNVVYEKGKEVSNSIDLSKL